MSLTLYYHPLSSFCWKALIGLYEREIRFEKRMVDLSNQGEREAFAKVWPIAKFPVLHDDRTQQTWPESSILLEHVDGRVEGGTRLIPSDPEHALTCRLRDRFFDLYIHLPMQRIVGDRLRPEGKRDPMGVDQARAQIETAYGVAEQFLEAGPWAMGSAFTLADCAAFPALYYANKVAPWADRWPSIASYFARLSTRPSVARVLEEAGPYLKMFPE